MLADRTVDLTQRILYLRSIPVAAEMEPRVLRVIAAAFRDRVFPKGTMLMRQGEPIDALHLLTQGSLTLTRNGKPFGGLKPPQSLGFLGILARAEGTYDATADEDLRTLELDSEAMIELLEEHPSFLRATLGYLAERMFYEMTELPSEALALPYENIEAPKKPLDFIERIFYLRQLSIFQHTNLNSLSVLQQQLEEVRLPAGTTLWGEGETDSERALMIVSGEIDCSTEGGAKAWRYGRATVMGGIEGMAKRPRWYTAVTRTPVVALEGRSHELLELFEDNFSMAMDFIGMVSKAVISLLERKAALGQQPLQVKRDVSKLGAVLVGA